MVKCGRGDPDDVSEPAKVLPAKIADSDDEASYCGGGAMVRDFADFVA